MAGRRGNRDENGRKLPWRPPGAPPATAADHPHAQERAAYRHKPDGLPTSTVFNESRKNRRMFEKLVEEAAPVIVPAEKPKKLPNPRLLTDGQLIQLVKELEKADRYDWATNARPEQIQPASYRNWLIMAGRGWGKTKCSSEAIREWCAVPGTRVAVVAKDAKTLRDVCFEGVSGLINCIPREDVKHYFKGLGDTRLELTNGSRILGFSSESPDSIRGNSFDAAVCDEFAAWPRHLAQDMLDQLWFCLRESKDPRVILATTPKRVEHVMNMIERAKTDPGIVITQGSTSDNKLLGAAALEELYGRYAGTALGRQELDGLLLAAVDGALWLPEQVEAARWTGDELPKFRKVIIGVDPSGSATGDATGIVALGYTHDKHIFVLGCYSTGGQPADRYAKVCHAAVKHAASEILVEYNFGGDNAIFGLESQWKHMVQVGQIDQRMPLIKKSTLRGDKATKASPVAALYEQQYNIGVDRIFHVPGTKENGIDALESQLISWAPRDKDSPNSLDALVIAARAAMKELGWESSVGTVATSRRIQRGWTAW